MNNPLEEFFLANNHRGMHKWMHYFEHYHTHFSKFRNRTEPIKILEIGVQNGGSTQMWLNYFGNCHIIGVDIDTKIPPFLEPEITLIFGDQGNREFLQSLVDQHGPFDVVIDDGGHMMNQQIITLEVIWPAMKEGGVFLCEDTHTSYWPEYGATAQYSFLTVIKQWTDRLNAQFDRIHKIPIDYTIKGIHHYNSMIFLDKGPNTLIQQSIIMKGLKNK